VVILDILLAFWFQTKMNVNAPKFNIDPKVWGPHLWATIHTLALRADSDHEIGPYLEFVNSLFFLLPCDTCRQDFIQWYKNHGDPFEGQAFEWSVDLHNYVNRKLAKKTMTLEESRDLWTSDLCSYSCTDRAGAASAAATAATAVTFDTKTSLLLVLLAIAVLVAVWSIRKK
jgi:hypothetical protein